MENQSKTANSANKEPYFHWTKELICEFAREVSIKYKDAQMWSGDLRAEMNIYDDFVKDRRFQEVSKNLIVQEAGETAIVNRQVLNEVIQFLYHYKHPEY